MRLKSFHRVHLMIGTAGHVDHGKTSLVRLLTGCETDHLREEQERGLSIDLGYAPCILPGDRMVGIVDVPGHERFIRNMVAGATSIDYVIFVIAADDGVMPQTREHLDILRLLGVRRGMIAVTKIDLVEPDWLELVSDSIREFVQGSFLADAPLIPISSTTGEGFDNLYTTLTTALDEIPPRSATGIFRLPVKSAFAASGYGTIVSGTPVNGTVHVGDTLELLPRGDRGRVRRLEVYKREDETAYAGECVALNIPDLGPDRISRGDVLAAPGYFTAERLITAHFRCLESAPRALQHNWPVLLHTGTAEVPAEVTIIGADEIAPGSDGWIQLRLERPAVVGPGDPYIVRILSPLITVGGGQILESTARRVRRWKDGLPDQLAAAHAALASPRAMVEHVLRRSGATALTVGDISHAAKLPETVCASEMDSLVADGCARALGAGLRMQASALFVHQDGVATTAEQILNRLERYHAENPLSPGMPTNRCRTELHLDPHLFAAALDDVRAAGTVTALEDRLRATTAAGGIDDADRELLQHLEQIFAAAAFAPPRAEEAAQHLALPPARVEALLNVLREYGRLIRIGDDLFHVDHVATARRLLIERARESGCIETGEFRDLLGTSRKHAIALLGYFDSAGLTRREENRRYLRSSALREFETTHGSGDDAPVEGKEVQV